MQKEDKKEEKFALTYALSLITQIGLVVSVITIFFIGLGYWIDKQLQTLPLFVIIFAFLAFVSSMAAVYFLILPIIKKSDKEAEEKKKEVKEAKEAKEVKE